VSQNKVSRTEVIAELWRRGNLSFKCHKVQKQMYDLFYTSPNFSTFVWLLSRQTGKSTLLAILALEAALREPNAVIKLVTDTKLHVKMVFEPIFNELLLDCPDDVKPTYSTQLFCWQFPNKSQIQFAGSDGQHYERLRGQKSKLILIDEAGFCDELERMLESVLRPTTTHTGGKIILSSTPPEAPDHDFLKYIEKAEQEGHLVKKTLHDNPLLSNEVKANIIKQMGGEQNERFRREYLCEIIRDPSMSVIPEFTQDLEKEIVQEWPKPPFFDCYEAMDVGFNDLTAILFAYYDFRADKVIIEDEFCVNGTNLQLNKLVDQIKDKERGIWFDITTQETRKPYLRFSDTAPIVLNELRVHSRNEINFITTKKDDKDSAINTLRMMLAAKKIIIHPRCINLIRHLRNVRWMSPSNKTKFGRSADDGHYDFVDAAIYLVRNIIYSKNPYPAGYGISLKDAFGNAIGPRGSGDDQMETYRRIFNIKGRR
jgi:PBSX family phage terminase large subunit